MQNVILHSHKKNNGSNIEMVALFVSQRTMQLSAFELL